MAHDVFISYRRSESKLQAQQLKRLLGQRFGNDAVFLDEKDIQSGDRFDHRLKGALVGARVVLVLVGTTWLEVLKQRATQSAEDWVRMEVVQALQQAADTPPTLLMPLLLPGASMPSDADWPPDLKAELGLFSKYQALTLVEPLSAVDDLELLLLTRAGLRCPANASQGSLSEMATSLEVVLKTHYRMQDIAQIWQNKPMPMAPGHNMLDAISGLHSAVKQAMPRWLEMTDLLQRQDVAKSCRRLLSLLYQMAIDPGVALFLMLPRPSILFPRKALQVPCKCLLHCKARARSLAPATRRTFRPAWKVSLK